MTFRLFACLLLAAGAARAEPARYALDPVHSRIVFLVSHAGFSRAIGTFSGLAGELHFDPEDPAAARVEATVPIGRLELGDAKWRARILDPTFFDVEDFPSARFVSTRVEPQPDGALRVAGALTLHGVTREITLDARLNRLDRHPLTLRRTAGFSARTVLRRADFGMQKWKTLVGDEVEVLIEIEATRRRGEGETD